MNYLACISGSCILNSHTVKNSQGKMSQTHILVSELTKWNGAEFYAGTTLLPLEFEPSVFLLTTRHLSVNSSPFRSDPGEPSQEKPAASICCIWLRCDCTGHQAAAGSVASWSPYTQLHHQHELRWL